MALKKLGREAVLKLLKTPGPREKRLKRQIVEMDHQMDELTEKIDKVSGIVTQLKEQRVKRILKKHECPHYYGITYHCIYCHKAK